MLISALTVGEKFSTGGITMLIGMLITFAVLFLLVFLIPLIQVVIRFLEEKLLPKFKRSKDAPPEIIISEVEPDKEISGEVMDAIKVAVQEYSVIDDTSGKKHEKITIRSVTKL